MGGGGAPLHYMSAIQTLLLTRREGGHQLIVVQFGCASLPRLLGVLFDLVSYGDTVAVQALNIVNNMALDTKFRRTLYDSLDTVLPSFENLLVSAQQSLQLFMPLFGHIRTAIALPVSSCSVHGGYEIWLCA